MPAYRLYCMSDEGEIIASHWIQASSDEDAVEAAKKEYVDRRCELWIGDRLVAEFET